MFRQPPPLLATGVGSGTCCIAASGVVAPMALTDAPLTHRSRVPLPALKPNSGLPRLFPVFPSWFRFWPLASFELPPTRNGLAESKRGTKRAGQAVSGRSGSMKRVSKRNGAGETRLAAASKRSFEIEVVIEVRLPAYQPSLATFNS